VNRTIAGAALALGALLAAAADQPVPTVQASMSQVFAPGAQAIWDVTNRATDDAGRPDPSKITAADWDKLGQAGQRIQGSALGLARGPVTVAAPGVKIQDEGAGTGAGAAQVQGYIDAEPDLFAAHVQKLAETGATVAEAARAHDTAKLFEVADSLDQVCEGCHVQFWYPPAKK
jgi:hypothetical protein